MKKEAASLGREAKDAARKAGQAAADMAHDRVDAAKDGVADELSGVSQALRRASDDLRDGSPQERTFAAAADALADMAETVRGRDLGDIVESLSDFARRKPTAFLAGAALLGFAGARLAKASQRRGGSGDPWQGGSGTGAWDDDDLRRGASAVPGARPEHRPAGTPTAGGTS